MNTSIKCLSLALFICLLTACGPSDSLNTAQSSQYSDIDIYGQTKNTHCFDDFYECHEACYQTFDGNHDQVDPCVGVCFAAYKICSGEKPASDSKDDLSAEPGN